VLLIACANVANLAVARLLRRDRELGLREALGAGRGRLVRQLLTESTLLSLIGGAMGLLLAVLAMPLLTAFVARFTSRTGEIAIDGRVLVFTTVVSILTGVAFGTAPSLLSRIDLGSIVRAGRHTETRFRRRLQGSLVEAQVSVSVVLLAGAGLLLMSVYKLQQVNTGMNPERVVAAEAYTTFSRRTPAEFLTFNEAIVEALEAEPDVVTAAVASAVPLASVRPGTVRYRLEGVEPGGDLPSAEIGVVTPGYFTTLGIPLLDGRGIEDRDTRDSAPVAVVNQTLARQAHGRPIIGTRVTFGAERWVTVVGVVGDVRQYGLAGGATPQIYVPLRQGPGINTHVLVRTTGDPARAAATITRVVHELDPDTPVENIATLDALRVSQLRRPQLTAILLSIFAGLALVVTLTGLAGVMAMHAARRTMEFGVRMALGATRRQVVRPVLGDGLRLLFAGLLVGVTASLVLTRLLSAYLFETTPTDPLTFAAVTAALVLAGGAACLGPAWRATRVDPQVVFRTE
jgi:putative ABC transport system permease protein